MRQLHSPSELATLLDANAPAGLIDETFSAAEWLETPGNVALADGRDLGMFDYISPGLFGVHVWFASRGRDAFPVARDMLAYMFDRGAMVLVGETPKTQRAAWLFARKVGFQPAGEDERVWRSVLRRGDFQSGNHPAPLHMLETARSAR